MYCFGRKRPKPFKQPQSTIHRFNRRDFNSPDSLCRTNIKKVKRLEESHPWEFWLTSSHTFSLGSHNIFWSLGDDYKLGRDGIQESFQTKIVSPLPIILQKLHFTNSQDCNILLHVHEGLWPTLAYQKSASFKYFVLNIWTHKQSCWVSIFQTSLAIRAI